MIRLLSIALNIALVLGLLVLAACAVGARAPPEGSTPAPTPPADEEMCRERFRPNLCPEV